MYKPVKPNDAINYLKRKKIVPTELWSDISGQEHAHAFTASHIMESEMLETMLRIIIDAKEAGTPREEVFKNFKTMLAEKGWHLNPNKIDDENYTNWRIGVIYNTNSRTAYNAGRYRQQARTALSRPYLVYKQVQRPTKRTEHEPLHNVCRPFNDPFWNTYYPPNGWGCDCEARSLSEQQAKTGNYQSVPGPLFNPDSDVPPEWRHNSGKEVLAPDFRSYTNLANIKITDSSGKPRSALRVIRDSYEQEIKEYKISASEFQTHVSNLYAGKELDQSFTYYAGNLDSSILLSIEEKIKPTDTKLIYTQQRIKHATRPSKKETQRLPVNFFKNLPNLNQSPDLIYLQKSNGNLLFFNHYQNDDNLVVKTAFNNTLNCSLSMDTASLVNKKDFDTLITDKYVLIYSNGKIR